MNPSDNTVYPFSPTTQNPDEEFYGNDQYIAVSLIFGVRITYLL